MNNVFLAHDKLTLFAPGYAIPPSLDFMQYAALEVKNCDVICIRPIASGKSESRRTSATKNTAKTTGNHTTTSKGQSVVLKGLNELKDLQRQSLTSMNEMISTMTVAVETLTQTKTSRKRKRDEMSESESSDQESNQEGSTAMAGNPPSDISS